jgi:hypothetical protein
MRARSNKRAKCLKTLNISELDYTTFDSIFRYLLV